MGWVGLGISQSDKIKLDWKKSPNPTHTHPPYNEIYKIFPQLFDLLLFTQLLFFVSVK